MKWPAWLYRFLPYLGRRQAEEDVQEELRLHLELERERQIDAGVPEGDALRAARLTLGNPTRVRERTRDVWGWRWLDDMGRDLRHAVRGLGRSPDFAATVVLVLALGIGANVAMFSVVYGMLIRPLPYPDSEAIVRVGELQQGTPGSTLYLTQGTMPQVVDEAESFEQLAAYRESSLEWNAPDGPVTLDGASVSPSLFPLLRARPHLGRLFSPDEARTGDDGVVLLSHRAWATRFGSDSDIVGSVLTLGNRPRTVVGVLEEGFYFPSPDREFWTPYVIPPYTPPQEGRAFVVYDIATLGRLRAGVSPEEAATEVRTILRRNDDGATRGTVRGGDAAGDAPEIEAGVIPLQEEMVAGYRPALLALTGATLLVLLIACINVALLLLARGITRQRALAVRAALGAGRGRLLRQLVTESVALSLGGGALGLAAATAVVRAAPALVPGDVARLHEVSVDGAVLAFTLGLSVVVGLVFGAVPWWQWSRRDLVHALNEGGAQSTGGFRLLRSSRTRALLATGQVALALLLLVGAGLLLRSFVGLVTVDRGYDPANVVAARVSNPALGFRTGMTPEMWAELDAATRRFSEALLDAAERLAHLSDVTAVGLSSNLPLASAARYFGVVSVEGRPAPSDPGELSQAALRSVSPGYFDAMRLRLRHGRVYTRLDEAGSPRVVVVNETFAREVFGGEPAVGQRVRFRSGGGGDEPWEVIGVVADIRYEGLSLTSLTGSRPEAFFSMHQTEYHPMSNPNTPFIAVRTVGDPLALLPFLQEAVTEAHPRARLRQVMTMDARLSAAVAEPRFYAAFVASFAALAVFLAAFGLYGLLSYTVAQRRGEIAIRMALGAQRGDVLALVVRQGAALVAAGAIVGVAAAAASSRVLESFLYGVAADDRLTFVAAPLALAAVALVACYIPARRATRVNPMEVLRFE